MAKKGTTLAILHDEGSIGMQWSEFIQNMFTEELPEECRDMNLDVMVESVTHIGEDDVCNINNCEYKLLLLNEEVLKLIRNEESTLRRCELLETQPEQLIALILGDESNVEFLQDANSALHGLKGHEAFSILKAKYPDQIFSDIMTILSPIYVVPHPNILSSEDKDQHLTLISNKPFPIGRQTEYVIEFSVGKKTRETTASLFNPCTLLVQNPGHPPGVVTLRILVCTRNPHTENNIPDVTRTQIGDDMKVWFQSDLDRVFSVLESQNNPMQFLCQAMNISNRRDNSNRTIEEKVDKLLTESFKKCVPNNKLSLVFGNIQHWGEDQEQDGNRSEYMPTLLHFSAMYGLRDLTAALLQCPGAVQAYGTANCDGDYPTNFAEKFGHWELRDFMETYMEVAAMVDNDYGSVGTMQTSQIMSSMVHGQYLSFGDESLCINEDIYMRMDDTKSDLGPTPPGYVPMRSFMNTQDPGMPQSVDYDSILHKVFGAVEEEEYEDMSFTKPPLPLPRGSISEPDRRSEELPPPPPPRDDKMSPAKAGPTEDTSQQDTLLILPKLPSNLSTAQEELIALQRKVKIGELTINQAVFRFKEWERKHKERAASFQYQQESLQRIRNSLMRSREKRRQEGKGTTIKISEPLVAGSSTYDKVLLKTRQAMMAENYGSLEKTNGKRSSSEKWEDIKNVENAANPSNDTHTFSRVRSFKNTSFGRPPMSLPVERGGSTTSRTSLGSIASTYSSSRSSGKSIGSFGSPTSFDNAQLPPALPSLPSGYRAIPNTRKSFSDEAYTKRNEDLESSRFTHQPSMENTYFAGSDAPPPIPPRDDRYSVYPTMQRHASPRPGVPPRNPRHR